MRGDAGGAGRGVRRRRRWALRERSARQFSLGRLPERVDNTSAASAEPDGTLMRPVLICPDHLLEHVLGDAAFPGDRLTYLVEKGARRAGVAKRGYRLSGDPTDPPVIRHALKGARGPALVAARPV